MHWGNWGPGWGGAWFGPFFMLVPLIIIVGAIVLAVGYGARRSEPPPPPLRSPRDILDERFARGEIDQEEYEQRRRTLER